MVAEPVPEVKKTVSKKTSKKAKSLKQIVQSPEDKKELEERIKRIEKRIADEAASPKKISGVPRIIESLNSEIVRHKKDYELYKDLDPSHEKYKIKVEYERLIPKKEAKLDDMIKRHRMNIPLK